MSSQKKFTWKSRVTRFLMLFIYAWYGQSSANQANPLDTLKLISFWVADTIKRFVFILFASRAYPCFYTILIMTLIIAP